MTANEWAGLIALGCAIAIVAAVAIGALVLAGIAGDAALALRELLP